jgi:hypothetical protein
MASSVLAPPQPLLEWSDDWADMLDELEPPLEAHLGDYDDDFWVATVVVPAVLRCAAEREDVPAREVSRPQFDRAAGPAKHPDGPVAQVIHRDRMHMGGRSSRTARSGRGRRQRRAEGAPA